MVLVPKEEDQDFETSLGYIERSCHRDRRFVKANDKQISEQLAGPNLGQSFLP